MTQVFDPGTTCVRRVWLTLGSLSMDCHSPAAGYFVTSFDPGAPDIRAVTNVRPDDDGIDDHTQFMGARTVSVDISAIVTAGAVIDQVAAQFAPFMVPSARPTLHYVLDRPGAPERIMVVRAAQYAYKVDDNYQRDIQLQFVAADPVAYDPAPQSATSWAGSSGNIAGRRYDLTFDRTYPAGSSGPSSALLSTDGDVPVQPLLRLFGPATGAQVRFNVPGGLSGAVGMIASYTIDAGHYIEVDCNQKTAFRDGDPAQNVMAFLNWNLTMTYGWPTIVPGQASLYMAYTATSATSATQVQAFWNDGYLT